MGDGILFGLSLCRRAGALVTGFDAVKESVLKGRAKLVLCAADTSAGTLRRVSNACTGRCPWLVIPRVQAQLVPVAKKPTAVFAVTQADLAQLCRRQLEREPTMKEERP